MSKFKVGDKVIWKPQTSFAYKGVITELVPSSPSMQIYSVDCTYGKRTLCFEKHLHFDERERNGFSKFMQKLSA